MFYFVEYTGLSTPESARALAKAGAIPLWERAETDAGDSIGRRRRYGVKVDAPNAGAAVVKVREALKPFDGFANICSSV